MQIPVWKMQTWGIAGLGEDVHVKLKQPQEEKAKELGLAEKEESVHKGLQRLERHTEETAVVFFTFSRLHVASIWGMKRPRHCLCLWRSL